MENITLYIAIFLAVLTLIIILYYFLKHRNSKSDDVDELINENKSQSSVGPISQNLSEVRPVQSDQSQFKKSGQPPAKTSSSQISSFKEYGEQADLIRSQQKTMPKAAPLKVKDRKKRIIRKIRKIRKTN